MAAKSKPNESVPIKVVVERSTRSPKPPAPIRPAPVAPVARRRRAPARKPVAAPKAPAIRPIAPEPIPTRPHVRLEHLPIEQRRRWMWAFVAVGMFVAVALWGLSLGAELNQTNQRKNIFSEISSLFRSFRFKTETPASPKQEEIRQLEDQVFPQFE